MKTHCDERDRCTFDPACEGFLACERIMPNAPSLIAALREIISDVASDPGGEWLNGGADRTMERVTETLVEHASLG